MSVPILRGGIPLLTEDGATGATGGGMPKLTPVSTSSLIDPDCCCQEGVTVACCDRALPLELTLSLTNAADCPCIDGMSIVLVWDETDSVWTGVGPGGFGTCTADTARWRLSCGGIDCSGFALTMDSTAPGSGSCISVTDTANVGCTCDPLVLEFTINASGIGCCNAIPGAGTITAVVTE
jgi:hypothetical protein